MTDSRIRQLAEEKGFELAGVVPAGPPADGGRYRDWVEAGMAGEMGYMTEPKRAALRAAGRLEDWVRFVICVGKLYNGPEAYSTEYDSRELGWISRYAWGEDYHLWMREHLEQLAGRIAAEADGDFRWRAAVDTAPILERSLAREAGLGWIGKNTCLIHQGKGSWFFLGELLVSLEVDVEAGRAAPPDRCGSCKRCIDACPTEALVPDGEGRYRLDSRRCISYLTIELRGPVPEELRGGMGRHVFGCDICQDVCPWNRKAPVAAEPAFQGRHVAPPLGKLAGLTEGEFREMFRGTAVPRARYSGFLRNVAVAMGNSGLKEFRAPLARLAAQQDGLVADHARWALERLAE